LPFWFEPVSSALTTCDFFSPSFNSLYLGESLSATRLQMPNAVGADIGMSKTFGMAGVRIGWVVTKDKNLYDQMAAFKDYTTICSSAPSEILSIIALRAKEKIVGNHLKRIERNLKLLDDFSTKHQNLFEWVQPKAGTIGFPKLKGYIDSLEFCQKVVNEAGIMLLPSTVYDYDNKHFRIGFGRENMPEALKKLEDYIGNNT